LREKGKFRSAFFEMIALRIFFQGEFRVMLGKFHEFSPKINLKDEIQIRNARRPIAPTLPIAMIGSPARPAGSLGKMLHQLCELAKGTTQTFCCSGGPQPL
jgi:hypothetical protein